jgi:hypothetical protein
MPPKMSGKKMVVSTKSMTKSTAASVKNRVTRKKMKEMVATSSDEDEAAPQSQSPQSPSPPPSEAEDVVQDVQKKTGKKAGSSQPEKPSQPLKKRRNFGTILSEEDEVLMGEWLRHNSIFYDKTLKSFKNTDRKKALWEEKAFALNLESGQLLKTWYESVRTRVGKLLDTKSGSAAKSRTERDKFIEANFGFLGTHISRIKGRTAIKLQLKSGPSQESDSGESEMEIDEDSQAEPSHPPVNPPHSSQEADVPPLSKQPKEPKSLKGRRGKNKSKRRADRSEDDEDDEEAMILQQLVGQQQQAAKIQGQIESLLNKDQISSTAAWGVWMGTMANQLDPRLLPQMYRDSTNMMLNLLDASSKLPPLQQPPRQPTPQPLQQPQQPQGTYEELLPQQQQQQQQVFPPVQQQTQQTWDVNWDTSGPMAGSSTVQAAFHPPRPASTPNISLSMPNVSGLSDLLNTSLNTPNPTC